MRFAPGISSVKVMDKLSIGEFEQMRGIIGDDV